MWLVQKKFWEILFKPWKNRVYQGLIRTLAKNENEINDPVEINTEIQLFYKKLFTENISKSKQNVVSPL